MSHTAADQWLDSIEIECRLQSELAAKDAEIARLEQRSSEQEARIAELYLSQKGRILSAKSTEYDIDQLSSELAAKDAEIARLRQAIDVVVSRFTRDKEQGYVTNDKTFAIQVLEKALEQKP